MKEIDREYWIVATRRSRKNASEAKYKMTRVLKTKLFHNQHNKRIKVCDKFGIKVSNSTIWSLMMDRMNNNNLWEYAITNEMSTLEIIGVSNTIHQIKRLKMMIVGNGHQCG